MRTKKESNGSFLFFRRKEVLREFVKKFTMPAEKMYTIWKNRTCIQFGRAGLSR